MSCKYNKLKKDNALDDAQNIDDVDIKMNDPPSEFFNWDALKSERD